MKNDLTTEDISTREEKQIADLIAIGEYGRALKERKWLIFLLVIVSLAVACAASIFQIPVYESTATVVLSKKAIVVLENPRALNDFATQDALLKNVARTGKLGYSVAQLKNRLQAERVGKTEQIAITAIDSSADKAKRIADATVEEFLVRALEIDSPEYETWQNELTRLDALLGESKTTMNDDSGKGLKKIGGIDEAIADTNARLAEIEKTDANYDKEALYVLTLRQTLIALEEERNILMTQRNVAMRALLKLGKPTYLLAKASKPTSPISPSIKKNLLFAAVASLLAGISLAIAVKPKD